MNKFLFCLTALVMCCCNSLNTEDVYRDQKKTVLSVYSMFGVKGTAFFWSDGKHIVTCSHVASDGTPSFFIDHRGFSVYVKLVGIDYKNDTAVYRILYNEEVNPVELADDLTVGESAIIIGHPVGLTYSMSAGIVSAVRKNFTMGQLRVNGIRIQPLEVIQIDASMNPGNSGGPIFNGQGELIGMCAFQATRLQQLNFAISVNTLKVVVEKIIAKEAK